MSRRLFGGGRRRGGAAERAAGGGATVAAGGGGSRRLVCSTTLSSTGATQARRFGSGFRFRLRLRPSLQRGGAASTCSGGAGSALAGLPALASPRLRWQPVLALALRRTGPSFLRSSVGLAIVNRIGMRCYRHSHVLQFANDLGIVEIQFAGQLVNSKLWHSWSSILLFRRSPLQPALQALRHVSRHRFLRDILLAVQLVSHFTGLRLSARRRVSGAVVILAKHMLCASRSMSS